MLPPLAPHPPPTQSTRKVLYAPTYCRFQSCVCVCVRLCACVSGLSGTGGTRTCTRGQVGPRDGEFQSDSAADRWHGDRRRRAVRDTCHSLFQSNVRSVRETGKNAHVQLFLFLLSYQHLQRDLTLARPSYYDALSVYLQMPVTSPPFPRPK